MPDRNRFRRKVLKFTVTAVSRSMKVEHPVTGEVIDTEADSRSEAEILEEIRVKKALREHEADN